MLSYDNCQYCFGLTLGGNYFVDLFSIPLWHLQTGHYCPNICLQRYFYFPIILVTSWRPKVFAILKRNSMHLNKTCIAIAENYSNANSTYLTWQYCSSPSHLLPRAATVSGSVSGVLHAMGSWAKKGSAACSQTQFDSPFLCPVWGPATSLPHSWAAGSGSAGLSSCTGLGSICPPRREGVRGWCQLRLSKAGILLLPFHISTFSQVSFQSFTSSAGFLMICQGNSAR